MVYRVFEDKRGYMWFLTDKGIIRFDGKTKKLFSSADGFNEIGAFHIVETQDGLLWFVTTNFKLYYFKEGHFFLFNTPEPVGWIDVDRDNKVWVLARRGSIYQIDSGKIIKARDFLDYGYVGFSLLHLGNGKFLVGMATYTYLIDQKNAKKILLSNTYSNNVPSRFAWLNNGKILITNYEGIFEFDTAGNILKKKLSFDKNLAVCFYQSAVTNDLFIGTNNGVFVFKNGVITKDHPLLLANHFISSIIVSRDQNYWISTINKGVFSYNPNVVHYTSEEGVTDNISYIKRENGNIYLISMGGLIKKFNCKGKKIVPFTSNKNITSMFGAISVNDTAIYILTNRNYKIKKGKIQFVSPSNSYFITVPLRAEDGIYMNYSSSIALNDTNNIVIDDDQMKAIRKKLNDDGYSIPALARILPIRIKDDIIYLQVGSGVAAIEYTKNNRYTIYPEEGLVTEINFTAKGNKVISTSNNGLSIYSRDGIQQVKAGEGLLSSYCGKVYINGNYVWVCSNKGLSRIKLDKNDRVEAITNFTDNDFLPNNEVNDILFNDSNVLVATSRGLSVFSSNARLVQVVPQVFVERIQINDKDTIVQDKFDLSYNENNITIMFNSPGLRSGDQTMYRYVLIGNKYDTSTVNSGIIQLSSLQPGSYLLKTWAKNIDGVWSSKPFEIRFNIAVPFWKSFWFIFAVCAVILTISGYFVFTRINLLRKENNYKYQLVSSELRALRLHINPHFIFNSLNSLHSYILKQDKAKAASFIISFSKLIRLIMNYSSRQFITISEEEALLKLYIDLEQSRFENAFTYKIDLERLEDKSVRIPTLVIQPFVENAIKYGLSGKEDGILEIRFSMQENLILCTVEDNGLGREYTTQQQSVTGKEYESTGIKYIEERLKLLFNKRITNPVIITDKHDEAGNATGTKVEIKLPIL